MNAFTSFLSSDFDAAFARPSDSRRTALRAAPACAPGSATPLDPFAARYGRPLPLPLRAEAAGMSWPEFLAVYASERGPLRLGDWSATTLPAGRSAFEATIAVGDTIHSASALACGPVAGMTAMLYDLGFGIEIHSFHRHDLGDLHVTFLLCGSGARRTWVMGMGESGVESTLRAMIAGINRIHTAAAGR
ncbi:MAG: 2-isopropylmalate synthase [Rhodococcus sp. (in: high G+C Gram-positive bacteria)]|uniref:2-isopropylmalate synthase n=1 Tax=Rhodococcus sp. TaxID=1831 RepID=UPI003D9ADF40